MRPRGGRLRSTATAMADNNATEASAAASQVRAATFRHERGAVPRAAGVRDRMKGRARASGCHTELVAASMSYLSAGAGLGCGPAHKVYLSDSTLPGRHSYRLIFSANPAPWEDRAKKGRRRCR